MTGYKKRAPHDEALAAERLLYMFLFDYFGTEVSVATNFLEQQKEKPKITAFGDRYAKNPTARATFKREVGLAFVDLLKKFPSLETMVSAIDNLTKKFNIALSYCDSPEDFEEFRRRFQVWKSAINGKNRAEPVIFLGEADTALKNIFGDFDNWREGAPPPRKLR